MAEVWLRTNMRPFLPAAAGCALLTTVGGIAAAGWLGDGWPNWLRVVAGAIAALALVSLMGLAWFALRPRLARDKGELLVRIHHARQDRVPLEIVECFLLGRGPAYLSRQRDKDGQVATIVVRLSPKAEAFVHREVDPRLGAWCDSQITLRGTWCEPISLVLVRRLNQRLAEAQRQGQAEAR